MEHLALQHPSDEDNILDLAQHGSGKDGSRMAVTLVVVTRSLMTARMTSVLMGVVTAVVTRWSRTLDGQGLWMVKDSDERTELMILKSSDFYRNFNHILYNNK